MRGKSLSKFFALLLLVSFAVSFVTVAITFAASTEISVDPATGFGDAGDWYHVEIAIEGVTDLNAWDLKLEYNSVVLSLQQVNVSEGAFLKGAGTYFYSDVKNAFGYVYAGCSVTGSATVSGSGVLVAMDFLILAAYPGYCNLTLSGTHLYDAAAGEIAHTTEDGKFSAVIVAEFTWTPLAPNVSQTVTFNASESFSPLGKAIVDYEWDFGDGTSIQNTASPLITHAFSTSSKTGYKVKLTVTDEDSKEGSVTETLNIWRNIFVTDIWVSDQNIDGTYIKIHPEDTGTYYPPYGIIVTCINSGTQTETFNLTLTFSVPTDLIGYGITSSTYKVTLGAGKGSGFSLWYDWNPVDALGEFLAPGDYEFTATATQVPNEDDVTDNVWEQAITILPPLEADFSWKPRWPIVAQTITFNSSASFSLIGKDIVSYTWDFGDGTPKVTTWGPPGCITHQYANYNPGGRFEGYNVTLTVIDEDGNNALITKEVEIWRDIVIEGIYPALDELKFAEDTETQVVVTAINLGTVPETFNVTLTCNGGSVTPSYKTITALGASKRKNATFTWKPYYTDGNYLVAGNYTFTATAVTAIPAEPDTANNVMTGVKVTVLPPTPTELRVEPSEVEVRVDDEFTIDIVMSTRADVSVYGFELKLFWDPALLECVESEVIPLWESSYTAKNEIGEDYYWAAATALPPAEAFTGSATLVRLTFSTSAAGDTAGVLNLGGTELIDSEGGTIAHAVEDGVYGISTRPWSLFEWTPEAPIPGEKVTFDASESFSPIGLEIIDYVWDFGDGSPIKHTFGFTKTTHVYGYRSEPYMVTLTVVDEDGGTESASKPLTIIGVAIKPTDLDSDGDVDINDLFIVAKAFGSADPLADVNKDGVVGIADLVLVALDYGDT